MIRNRYLPAITDKPWWLAGGIPVANCTAAYRARGATSKASSYVNLANPGTFDLTLSGSIGWTVSEGWKATGGYLRTAVDITNFENCTIAISCVKVSGWTFFWENTAENRLWDYGPDLTFYYYGQKTPYANLAGGNGFHTFIISADKAFRDGVQTHTGIVPGATARDGTTDLASGGGNGLVYAASFYNVGLSHAQAVALHSAMSDL